MSSVCSGENLVKSGVDSGVVASVVSGVPVHADLPRARVRGEQHMIREGRIKGSLCSIYRGNEHLITVFVSGETTNKFLNLVFLVYNG